MSIVAFNDVQETTTSTGSGDLVLAGATSGNQTFLAAGCADQDQFSYTIKDPAGSPNFESGIARYNSGANSITRLEIDASSNAGAAVVFGAGSKTVYMTVLAKQIRPVGAFPFTSSQCLWRWNSILSKTDISSLGYANKLYDISGNVRHSLSNTTNPPKWAQNSLNGKFPALFFNLNHRILVSAMPSLGSPLACTVVFVGQNFQASGNSHIYNWAGNPIGFGSNTPLDYMYDGTLPAAHAMSAESKLMPWANYAYYGQPIIGIHVYNGTTSVQSLNNNEATISPGTTATGSTNFFTIGSDSASGAGGSATQPVRMLLGELCTFNFAFSSTQRAAMLLYLKNLFELVTP